MRGFFHLPNPLTLDFSFFYCKTLLFLKRSKENRVPGSDQFFDIAGDKFRELVRIRINLCPGIFPIKTVKGIQIMDITGCSQHIPHLDKAFGSDALISIQDGCKCAATHQVRADVDKTNALVLH